MALNDGGGPAGVWMFAHFDNKAARSALVMFATEERSPEEKYTVWAINAQTTSPRNLLNAFWVGFCCGALLDSASGEDLDMIVQVQVFIYASSD